MKWQYIQIISIKVICIAIVCLCFCMTAIAQQYNFKNISVQDGLAQSQVYAMLQDSRGYLWMGTRGGGVSKYDGKSFTNYSDKDGLCNNYISCMMEDSSKNVWFGTKNGASEFDGKKFINYKLGASESEVFSIISMENKLYFVSSDGLYSKENNKAVLLSSKSFVDGIELGNTIYLATKNEIYTYQNKQVTLFKKFTESEIQCLGMYKNQLLIGTYGKGVFSLKNEYTAFKNEKLATQIILDFYVDNQQKIWISTLNNGVCIYDDKSKQYSWLTEKEGLCKNHIRSVLQDNTGSFWIGSSGNGISYYAGKRFVHYDKQIGLPGNFIYAVFKDSKQRLWVGSDVQGISLLQKDTCVVYNKNNLFGNYKVRAIAEDKVGNLYFGTEGYGIFIFDGKKFTPIDATRNYYIRSLTVDNMGNVWAATADKGVLCISTSVNGNIIIKTFNKANQLPDDRISCVAHDENNNIWFGTDNNSIGVIKNNGEIKSANVDSLPRHIRCIAILTSGKIWFGAEGNGIICIDSNFKKINQQVNEQLASSNIYQLNCTENELFVGTEKGLDYILLDENRSVISHKHFGKGEGFVGIETNLNAMYREANGTVWSGTINGLEEYLPNNISKNKCAPLLSFQDIKVNYNSLASTKYATYIHSWNMPTFISFKHTENRISFNFLGINISNPDAVLYKWKLEGADDTWSPDNKETQVSYSNLLPGNYTFLVQACNEDSVWSSTPLKYSFEIKSAWWQLVWIKVVGIFVALSIVYFLYKKRIQYIKQKAKEAQAALQLQKDVAELEHTALRLQMNPHFIFNAMNSIQSLIGSADEEKARYYLAKFSKLMRQILNNSRTNSITLEEEMETLDNYLLVEQFTNSIPFEYSITKDDNIDGDFIQIPSMLIQPFVENSLKHGLRYLKEKKGKINVHFSLENDHLICSIEDNGVGRKQAALLQASSKEPKHVSAALDVTANRMRLLNKENKIQIEDVLDANNTCNGTKVTLTIKQ